MIPVSELKSHNWDRLIDISTQFVIENLHHYDQLIELVWGDSEEEAL